MTFETGIRSWTGSENSVEKSENSKEKNDKNENIDTI